MLGIIGPGQALARGETVACMLESLLQEPGLVSGSLRDDALDVAAGWTVHPGSYSDCLPVWNEAGDIGLLLVGEHYADPSEAARLRSAGHQFTPGDASGLVHLYEELGPGFCAALNGTFSGLVIDRRRQEIILFNDRFGLGRIYLHERNGSLYFATQAKALLRVLPAVRQLDLRGFGELLVCGGTLQDRTLFHGISLLPPGSRWTYSPGRGVRKESYFNRAEWETQTALPPEEYYEALKATFNRILPRYFRARQSVALSLTGGLDSRMIIAGAGFPPGQLPCYTFGGMYRDCEDVRVARRIAALCRQPYQVITVDQRFFPSYLELASKCVHLTDGAMDVSGAVGLYVNRLARGIAPIRMTGNYGSEILRQHVAFRAGRVPAEPFAGPVASAMEQALATFQTEKQACSRLSFIAFKQVPWHHYARFAAEQSQLTIRAPYLDNELVALAYRAPAGSLLNKHLCYRYTTDMCPALTHAPTDRGMLRKPPLIPSKLVELSMELMPKAEYYFDYGMPQWLVRTDRMMGPLQLERLFLGQQKYYHFRTWYRHALAAQVKEVLLDPRALARPYLKRREVEAIVARHTNGRGNHTLTLHKLMTCELLHRLLLEPSTPVALCT